MVSISLCMIVKNEEKVLDRCLESLAPHMDEIIIVDTGSQDGTKKIAGKYTDKIYDFTWTGDFSEARNFAASKAVMDYIYTADADEYLEKEDRKKLEDLKKVLLPEVEIVQMLYCTPLKDGTVYNFEKEYRPKLYKRVREFVWIDPIHETLRLDPVVYDSDIEVQHRPQGNHAGRDFRAFEKLGEEMISRGMRLSKKLHHMYAMELYKNGTLEDFEKAEKIFLRTAGSCPEERNVFDEDEICEANVVLMRYYRMKGDLSGFMAYAIRDALGTPSAELCLELGLHFEDLYNATEGSEREIHRAEAVMWYKNATEGAESILDIRSSGEFAKEGLERLR